MRSSLLCVFSVICTIFFSGCLFLSNNMLLFWLFLELGALGLIPSFFVYSGESAVYSSLFTYIVISGVSSSLIVCGFLFEGLLALSVLGLLVKFGVFPFIGWVYTVITGSNWLVVWGLSTTLKTAFLFFCFFLSSGAQAMMLIDVCCVLTFIFVGLLFWVCTYSWFYYWCHVMVCSSAALLVMSPEISLDLLVPLFLLYVLWATFVILLLVRVGSFGLEGGFVYFSFVALLVSFPGSLIIFYKLFVGFCVYSCGYLILSGWVIYNISEQLFLLKYLIGEGLPSLGWCGSPLV